MAKKLPTDDTHVVTCAYHCLGYLDPVHAKHSLIPTVIVEKAT